MSQNPVPEFGHTIPLLKLLLFSFVVVAVQSSVTAIDPLFQDCSAPTTCGGQPIRFPFYTDDASCGYPGFGLSCINQTPYLSIAGAQFIVHEILYTNQSIRVSNAAVLGSGQGQRCFPQIQNFSVDDNDRFYLAPGQRQLFVLSNCNITSSVALLSNYRIDCPGEDVGNSSLALFSDDPLLGNVTRMCGRVAESPVAKAWEGGGGYSDRMWLERGFVLEWVVGDCQTCVQSGGRCGFNHTNYHFSCFCPDRPHASYCPGQGSRFSHLKLIMGIAFGIGITALLTFLLVYCFWRKMIQNSDREIEAFIKCQAAAAPKRFHFSDVKKITNSLKEKLGQGGYGSVYKGKLPDGHPVAVKILNESRGNGQDFINEVASISRTSHVNVVTLLGFCLESKKRALIYEFMPNGSLDKFIYNGKRITLDGNHILGWEILYRIAVGIAKGLEYLHNGCNTRIVHFDIKPHNILLDENWCPKISDFGLAKLCTGRDSIVSLLDARGTIGYIAPEVFSRNFGNISHKSDVYSYGMMVLEMAGGKKNIDVGVSHSSEVYFPTWIYQQLELEGELKLQGSITSEESKIARKMMIVGLWCIQTNPSDRPSISKVIEMLEGRVDVLHIPPKPFLSSPPRAQQDDTFSSTS